MASTNGTAPRTGSGSSTIDSLRERPVNVHLFRGFGPVVAGLVLFVVMLWLAPSVAPEHIVERPATATTVITTTTVRAAP